MLSLLVTRAIAAVEAGVDERGQDPFADATGAPGLVDHEHPPGGTGLAEDVVDGQRRQPAQVDHADAETGRGQAGHDPQLR